MFSGARALTCRDYQEGRISWVHRRDAGAARFDATVARMLAGDEQAFREAYRAVHPGLVRYLSALVGSGDAEDVASETWAQVCRDLPSFHGDGDGFRGWVSTIGRHRAMDHVRALRRRPQAGATEAVLAERPSPDESDTEALIAISTSAAMELIRTLPPDQAEAVLLRAVMGMDAKTAGRVLGKRPGAVRTAAYRGLRALATRLEDGLDDDGAAPDHEPENGAQAASDSVDSDVFRALVAGEVT